MSVCCECCVLSGRGLRLDDHSSGGVLPRVVCKTESDGESLIMRRPWPTGGLLCNARKYIIDVHCVGLICNNYIRCI